MQFTCCVFFFIFGSVQKVASTNRSRGKAYFMKNRMEIIFFHPIIFSFLLSKKKVELAISEFSLCQIQLKE